MPFHQNMMIGFVALFAGLITSRLFTEKSLRLLDSEQRQTLFEAFSKYRLFSVLPIVIIAMADWFIIRRYFPYRDTNLSTMLMVGLLIGIVVVSNIFVFARIRHFGFPPLAVRYFLLGRALQYTGMGVFIVSMIMSRPG